jgi:hypothetical protein
MRGCTAATNGMRGCTAATNGMRGCIRPGGESAGQEEWQDQQGAPSVPSHIE